MTARARFGVVVAAWLAGAGGYGCGGRGANDAVGVSTASPRMDGVAKERDAGPARPLGIPADFRTTLTKINGARLVSNGHAGGRYEVDVYGNDAGRAAALSVAGPIPVGARLIKEHFERADGDTKPGPIMMMEKMPPGFDPEHGDWRYVVIDSTGVQVEDGHVESCAGCHGDAPRDHVFRVVEPARPAP